MTKRQRFVATTLILLLLFINLLRLPTAYSNTWWFVLPLVALLFTWLSFRQDLRGITYATTLFLPTFYTLVFVLIFRVFVFTSLFRLVLLALYGVGFYVILLCENILNISALKVIPLHRAARTVNLLITVVTSFLGFTVLYKLSLSLWWQFLLVFGYSLLASWQYLWTIEFRGTLSQEIKRAGLLLAFVAAEVAFALTFLPLRVFVRALLVTTPLYFGLSVLTQYFQRRLQNKHLLEYAAVILATVLVTVLVL